MGLFSKKEKVEELPPSTSLPDAPENSIDLPSFEIPQMEEALPDAPVEEFQPAEQIPNPLDQQTPPKEPEETVLPEKLVEDEPIAQEDIPRAEDFQMPQTEIADPYPSQEDLYQPEPMMSAQVHIHKDGPMYCERNVYLNVLDDFEIIKSDLGNIERFHKSVKELDGVSSKKHLEFKNSLLFVQKKLLLIEKSLFNK